MKSEELALLDRFVDDRLLPGDLDLVNEMLVEDEQFRKLFIRYLDLHNNLAWIEPVAQELPEPVSMPQAERPKPKPFWWPVVAAAVLILAGALAMRLAAPPQGDGAIASIAKPMALTGRLNLPAGKSNLQLPNGTMLEVVGPAELEIMPDQSVDLFSGRLGVELPDGVDDFRLRTPVVEILDLGTAFLAAASAEQTVVAVRQGKVRVLSGGDAVDMAAGMSAVFRKGEGVARFPLNLEDQDYLEQAFIAGVTLNTGVATAPVRLSGAARWVDPDQVPVTRKQRDDDMLVSLERQNWTLPADVTVITTEPGFVDEFEKATFTVTAGSKVDMYRVFFAPTRGDRGLASIEFPMPILGVVAITEDLAALDQHLDRHVKIPDAKRGIQLGRGLESRTGKERNHDVVNIQRNRRIATIAMAVGETHVDEVVILVASPVSDTE
jgi:hypothetical protein